MRTREIQVQNRQTLEDLALQHYGSIDGVEMLLIDNRTQLVDGFNTQLSQGMILKIREEEPIDAKLIAEMQLRGIHPANGELVTSAGLGDHNDDYNEDHG